MCLAVPGKIQSIDASRRATVDMLGVTREASLRLVPEAQVGDYVLVHAGFGIQVIDPEEAHETLELLREMPDVLVYELPSKDDAAALA
ncbi:HypC/HybG/HupF family hydrogenase formation chaperone [Collinsella vaginalis]|uniref:HypC/HybG/HupF family hydrogenase formation chaperone n=1 Tax=Collinsella vaginalis TaxID=1870987 RepID=UPI000A272350|nr:HypC/HybG/HupF family hydrogenase formation chaperone [Collinsella vaginalis]